MIFCYIVVIFIFRYHVHHVFVIFIFVRIIVILAYFVTRFVRMLLHLLDSGAAKSHLKHLTELFSFLHDFAKLGDQEADFLLSVQVGGFCF